MYTMNNANPRINFERYNFWIPWDNSTGAPRKACVNSFGFGGTNSHAVLTEYVQDSLRDEISTENERKIIAVSAIDGIGLRDNVQSFHDDIRETDTDIDALAYTSTCRRDHNTVRTAFVVRSQKELKTKCHNNLKNVNKMTHYESKRMIVYHMTSLLFSG